MSFNLNEASQYLDEVGTFPATIVKSENGWTKNSVEAVMVTYRTDDDREKTVSYTEGMRWKLKRVAQAAGLSDKEMEAFEPEYLLGRKVMIKVTKSVKGDNEYLNIDAYSITNIQSKQPANDLPF